MTDPNDPHGLWTAFCDDVFGDRSDVPPALPLADWLEEQGRGATAAAVRWMRRERKRPCSGKAGGQMHRHGPCDWWTGAASEYDGVDEFSDLPGGVYAGLPGGVTGSYGEDGAERARTYPDPESAVEALGHALLVLEVSSVR